MTGLYTLKGFSPLHQEAQDKCRALAAALVLGQGFFTPVAVYHLVLTFILP